MFAQGQEVTLPPWARATLSKLRGDFLCDPERALLVMPPRGRKLVSPARQAKADSQQQETGNHPSESW